MSLKQNINIDSKTKRLRAPDAGHAYLDGVSKATASVRIINQSVLSAALKVSRKKLGFAQGSDPDQVARIKPDLFEKKSVAQLLDAGLIQHVRVTNRDVEKLFAGSAGAGLDPEALAQSGRRVHRPVPGAGVGADGRAQPAGAGQLEQAARTGWTRATMRCW